MKKNEIAIIYGDRPEHMLQRLLEKALPVGEIPLGLTIGIKPNLVVSKPSSSGATTDPQIVEEIIKHLQSQGHEDIKILESAWVGGDTQTAFKVCGYEQLSNKYGVPLINLERDSYKGENIKVCNEVFNIDYLINAPVLKAHCQTKLTCALKNLKGCIPDSEKKRFHTIGLHEPIARLNTIIKTNLIVIDGIITDLTFEEGGTPVKMNRVIAAKDPVLVDAYAATLLGYEPGDIEYIELADKYGVGNANLSNALICELNKPSENIDIKNISLAKTVESLLKHVHQDKACSACLASLIHALQRLGSEGELKIKEKIKIGQGFNRKIGPHTGIGTCTRYLDNSLKGCPPSAREIIEFLKK